MGCYLFFNLEDNFKLYRNWYHSNSGRYGETLKILGYILRAIFFVKEMIIFLKNDPQFHIYNGIKLIIFQHE